MGRSVPHGGCFLNLAIDCSHSPLRKQFLLELACSSPYVSSWHRSVKHSNTHTLQAIKDVSASYDALVDLFESMESFLRRLNIYSKIPPTSEMTEIFTKILIEFLSTLALGTQQAKQGRLSKRLRLTCWRSFRLNVTQRSSGKSYLEKMISKQCYRDLTGSPKRKPGLPPRRPWRWHTVLLKV